MNGFVSCGIRMTYSFFQEINAPGSPKEFIGRMPPFFGAWSLLMNGSRSTVPKRQGTDRRSPRRFANRGWFEGAPAFGLRLSSGAFRLRNSSSLGICRVLLALGFSSRRRLPSTGIYIRENARERPPREHPCQGYV